MYSVEDGVYILDTMLGTERRRHLVGGMLISIGVMCFGLAITAMTLKEE